MTKEISDTSLDKQFEIISNAMKAIDENPELKRLYFSSKIDVQAEIIRICIEFIDDKDNLLNIVEHKLDHLL